MVFAIILLCLNLTEMTGMNRHVCLNTELLIFTVSQTILQTHTNNFTYTAHQLVFFFSEKKIKQIKYTFKDFLFFAEIKNNTFDSKMLEILANAVEYLSVCHKLTVTSCNRERLLWSKEYKSKACQ